jgi:hypothetical protein
VIDVAATILAHFDVEIPSHLDGRPLAFEPEAPLPRTTECRGSVYQCIPTPEDEADYIDKLMADLREHLTKLTGVIFSFINPEL